MSRALGLRSTALVVLVVAVAAAAAPSAPAAPNPVKALGELRAAWKKSEELQVAAKLVRKTLNKQVGQWRRSGGEYCPWRGTSWDDYCSNGQVIVITFTGIYVRGVLVGTVSSGDVLHAGCIGLMTGSVRVLWPAPG